MAQNYSPKYAVNTALRQDNSSSLATMSGAASGGEGTAAFTADSGNKADFTQLLSQVSLTRNRAAFVTLFDHFAPRIKGYLMQGGFPESEAEEVAQDTMLQVWQKAEYFNPERASASTWIYTIARNKKIDRLRKHKPIMLDMDYLMESGQDAEMATDSPQPDIFLDQRQLTQRLTDAIQDLPEDQAALVRKAFFEDMSHTDIATKMSIPLGTVKSRLRSGLARLRKALDNNDHDSFQ